MPKPLTELERNVLDYLIEYLRRNTYQPSIREIGRAFSIKSTKTVSELLQSLANKGWIERDPSRSRGVRLHGVEMPGDTVAVPLLNDGADATAEAFALDRRVAGGAGAFLVVMQGSHLREYGIWEGDLMLFEPVAIDAVETGDILLVRRPHGAEVCRCNRRGTEIVLEPSSGDASSLVLTGRQSTIVQARARGVVRRLRPFVQHAAPDDIAVTP